MLLPLLILFKNEKKILKWVGNSIIIGWGLFVGASRIVIGAHYASDVLFSSAVAFVTVILLYKWFYFKKNT
ncbi:MAG: phosphatase PAP2 family protein [Candidatus Helarchaeota archaeon]